MMVVKEVLWFVAGQSDDHIDWAMLVFNYKLMRGVM
jgi:hypothetical protein